MSTGSARCPLCGRFTHPPYLKLLRCEGYRAGFVVQECTQCGMLWENRSRVKEEDVWGDSVYIGLTGPESAMYKSTKGDNRYLRPGEIDP